jgi:hypothetical protein
MGGWDAEGRAIKRLPAVSPIPDSPLCIRSRRIVQNISLQLVECRAGLTHRRAGDHNSTVGQIVSKLN